QGIVNLAPRRRRFWPERGDVTRRLRRESRDVAKGHERKDHLALRINVQQAIDLRILEAANDLCRQSQGCRDREKIGQHSAVVPAEMAIGARLIFPSIAPVDAGAGDNYRRVSNGGLIRGRFNWHSAIICNAQPAQTELRRSKVIETGLEIRQVTANQIQLDFVKRAGAGRGAKVNLATRILSLPSDAGGE